MEYQLYKQHQCENDKNLSFIIKHNMELHVLKIHYRWTFSQWKMCPSKVFISSIKAENTKQQWLPFVPVSTSPFSMYGVRNNGSPGSPCLRSIGGNLGGNCLRNTPLQMTHSTNGNNTNNW